MKPQKEESGESKASEKLPAAEHTFTAQEKSAPFGCGAAT